MLEQEQLEAMVHEVIHQYHEVEATGDEAEVIHMDVSDLKLAPPARLEGRRGVFIKLDFEYTLTFLSSNALDEDDPVRYKQSVRLTEAGETVAISEPVELWD